MGSNQIKSLADPTDAQDAVTKAYVDALLARIESLEILNEGFTDARDGNAYEAVKIGDQIWMAENLKYLPEVIGPATGSDSIPYYYVYEYDGTDVSAAKAETNYIDYGVLFNYAAALDACPNGWHLPSDAEWTTLADFLGGTAVAGGKLKETDTIHWDVPNLGATNETGFTALPGGYRFEDGSYLSLGIAGIWWTSTETGVNSAWDWFMRSYQTINDKYDAIKERGFSVRCIKD